MLKTKANTSTLDLYNYLTNNVFTANNALLNSGSGL